MSTSQATSAALKPTRPSLCPPTGAPTKPPADQRSTQARQPNTRPPAPTWMDVRMEQMLWQGLQWSWMMSRHSVPSLYTCTGAGQRNRLCVQ